MMLQDKLKFSNLMIKLSHFYDQQLTDQFLEIYWQSINNYNFSIIQKSVMAHIRDPEHGSYFPLPADIHRQINNAILTKATLAWTMVQQEIVNHGYTELVKFEDPLIYYSLQKLGGWSQVCRSSFSQLNDLGKQFRQNYFNLYRQSKFPADPVGSKIKSLLQIDED